MSVTKSIIALTTTLHLSAATAYDLVSYGDMVQKNGFESIICEAKSDCFYTEPNASNLSSCTFEDPCDLLTARDQLSGGDHLYLLAGTYSDSYVFTDGAYGDYDMIMAFGRTHAFQAPLPDALNRITIKAYPGHVAVIDGQYNTGNDTGADCFYTDQSFITISDLTFRDCKIGITVGQNAINYDVTAVLLQRNQFTGSHFINDNGGSIAVYFDAIDTVVQNNLIEGPGSALGSMNSAGIYYTHDRHIRILNNEIAHHRTGIHYKHDHSPSIGDTGSVIANNFIRDVSIAARLNTRHTHIHNNISTATAGSFSLNHCSGATGEGGDYNTLTNNYFFDLGFNGCSDAAVDQGAFQNTLKNNIIVSRFFLHPWQATPHETTMDHNLYVSDVFENNVAYNLSQWQTHHGQDANSIHGTPTHSNPALSIPTDYQLLPGSPGYQAGDDGLNMGPDVENVGLVDGG